MVQEARWFAARLASMQSSGIFPMCNVGSSTVDFRTRDQPWIDELIFGPLARQGYVVTHLDTKSAQGVDIVGDLGEQDFLEQVASMRFKSVFCSNLLEHVVHPEAFGKMLASLVPSGGYLFVSVPYAYPYHPDPIDNGLRPTVAELAALFPGTHIVGSAVLGGDTLLRLRRREPVVLAFTLLRFLTPFYKPVSWWRNRAYVPWWFRPLTASCLVLQKR